MRFTDMIRISHKPWSDVPADVTPGLVLIPTSDMTRSKMNNDENPEKCEHEEWINRNVHYPWICATTSMGGRTVICR